MAVRVIEKKKDRKYTFLLSHDDKDIRRMVVRRGHKVVLTPDSDYDIAVFPGGPDLAPMYYGESMLPCTGVNWKRDLTEVQFYRSLSKDRMKLGICRGAQLLNVMSGGRMWQHVNNHVDETGKGHLIRLWQTNETLRVNSRHHQMMIPASDGWVIASAKEATYFENETMGVYEREVTAGSEWLDPEVIYYSDTHSLCWQAHPEDQDQEGAHQDALFQWIDTCWDEARHHKMHQQGWEG